MVEIPSKPKGLFFIRELKVIGQTFYFSSICPIKMENILSVFPNDNLLKQLMENYSISLNSKY
jgi:hypothetical protein